jgi:hypothetical protein
MTDKPASYVCPHCGAESWNPNDLMHRYCGRCHLYADDPVLLHRALEAEIARLNELARIRQAQSILAAHEADLVSVESRMFAE